LCPRQFGEPFLDTPGNILGGLSEDGQIPNYRVEELLVRAELLLGDAGRLSQDALSRLQHVPGAVLPFPIC
jgi:hypothetical protein